MHRFHKAASRGSKDHTPTRGSRRSSNLPPTAPDFGSQQHNAKRLLSNAGAKRGVRGELLTNGYKSLRAQGMLKALHGEIPTGKQAT